MKSILSLDEALIRRLVNDSAAGTSVSSAVPAKSGMVAKSGVPASSESLTERQAIADTFARAAWTGIAEPGDSAAGKLIALLGAAAALEAVLGAESAESIVTAILDHRDTTDSRSSPHSTADWLPGHELHADGLHADELHADELRSTELHAAFTDDELDSALARWRPRLTSHDAIAAFRHAKTLSIRVVTPSMPEWPVSLNDLGAHCPPALWVRGDVGVLARLTKSVALVGARAATGYGEHLTMELSAGLCDRGYTIVSGAAYGIDGVAHRTALASGAPTVAFLAGGADRYYPSGHHSLLDRICATGAIVSELPCGAAPTKWRFLQRNRLIAASSCATVVVEAGMRSGSLNTAGHAATLGRPLGAVPGPVTSPSSAGCHRLIREFDAVCVTTADEVVELLGLDHSPETEPGLAPLTAGRAPSTRRADCAGRSDRSAVQTRVLDALSVRTDRSTMELARSSGLSPTDVEAALGTLSLEGAATESGRGWRRRSG